MNLHDSGLRRNDTKTEKRTFYGLVKNESIPKQPATVLPPDPVPFVVGQWEAAEAFRAFDGVHPGVIRAVEHAVGAEPADGVHQFRIVKGAVGQ